MAAIVVDSPSSHHSQLDQDLHVNHQIEAQQIKHKTLSAYYPSILTLRSVLRHYAQETLIRLDDPPEYLNLLSNALIASRTDHVTFIIPSFPNGEKWIKGTQQESIDRILDEVYRRDGRDNVLLFGSKNSFAFEELPINTARPAFENRHAGSPSGALRNISWKILRSRIGDRAFRDILLYSVYLPIGNNCFLQLSGKPLHDLYIHPTDLKHVKNGEKRKRDTVVESGRQRRKRQRIITAASKSNPDQLNLPLRENTVNGKSSGGSTAERVILRGKMFYGKPKRDTYGRLFPGLPSHHTLNTGYPKSAHGRPPSDTACLNLLQQVFPTLFLDPSSSSKRLKSKDAGPSEGVAIHGTRAGIPRMTGMIRELYARHAEVDYKGLIRRCRDRKEKRDGEGLEPISKRSVFRFVGAVVKGLFPPSIIGSEYNQGILLRHMRHFIEMKQYEAIDLHSLLQGIKIDDISWLQLGNFGDQRSNPNENRRKRGLVEDLIYWIFTDWLIPLLRNTFYVTETAATRYETVYYLQGDWQSEIKPHLRKLEVELLEELSRDEASFAMRGPLGVSAVRLVPKPKGFRPIVNLGKRLDSKLTASLPAFTTSRTTTANQVLRGLHQVLTCEKNRKKGQMGNTLFGTNEVFPPLQALKRELVAKHGKLPRLYFVKMDIKSAFDTIKQEKMIEIVEELLDKDNDYCIMMYSLLLPLASKASQGSARRLWKYQAMPNDGQSTEFGNNATSFAKPLRNAAMVDLMRRKHVTEDDCMELLKIHIQNNVWEVEGKLFRQKTGIPQGSKISSLLCSFFYAVLEKEHLGFVNTLCSRLLRYIDDFLFITDDLSLARRFIQRMKLGFPEFGAFISPGKTLCSFEFASGSQVAPVCMGPDGKSYFPFCGFLIDVVTLDMSMDYLRVQDTHIKQTFALRFHRRKASGFIGWFSRQLENRNHVAYLDSKHNDLHTVRVNIFLNFALTTMKVPHYFDLVDKVRISERRAKIVADALYAVAEYTYMAGRARVRFASREDKAEHYAVRKRDFIFIAQTAMVMVLSKKASQFKLIIHCLKGRMGKDRKAEAMVMEIKDVVEEGWKAVKDVRY